MSALASPRTTIYLLSTSGHPNYGDELIVKTWLRRVRRASPDSTVWIDCPNPAVAATLFADAHPHVRCTNTIWRLTWEAPGDAPHQLIGHVHAALEHPDATSSLLPGIQRFREADVVHLLGGGFINRIWPRNFGLLAALWWAAKQPHVATALTGAGFVPAAAPPTLFTELLGPVDVVDTRDEKTARLLRGLTHKTTTGDDALLDFESRPGPADAPDTMLCIQGDLVELDRGELLAWTLSVLKHWRVTDQRIGFVECIPHVDREAFVELAPFLPQAELFSLWDIMNGGFPARPGQRWITTRFHPHLLGSAAGAAGVVVTIDPVYYHNKHRSLFDFGTGWASAAGADGPLADPSTIEATPSTARARLLPAGRAKSQLAEQLYTLPRHQRHVATAG